jgi:uncharacterized protein
MDSVVHISEAAKRLGVTPHHLRVLEWQGRIPPTRRDLVVESILSSILLCSSASAWASDLTSFSAEAAKPFVALFLFLLGVYILARFAFRRSHRPVVNKPISRKFLSPLGLVAGFLDAAGGGGWGAINTSTLMSTGRMEPRKVVGTVDTSEFLVSVAASIGFFVALSFAEIPWSIVAALLIGGVIAAPLAAFIVRLLPARILGTAVGAIILLTNMRTFLETVGVDGGTATLIYALIAAVSLGALTFAIFVTRQQAGEPAGEGEAA